METLFSVIIPVYNAEAYLCRCLDSLLSQGESSAELILVNDGSTDSSPDICRKYAAANRNVRFFTQVNSGVSAARNLGLRQATGTYILFVDSDDFVDPAYFRTIRQVMSEQRPDLLLFSHKTVGRITYQVHIEAHRAQGPAELADALARSIRNQSFNPLWSKVYLRSIICRYGLTFDPSLCIDEDFTFSFAYALHATSMLTIPDPLYYFCVENPASLSRKQRDYLPAQLLAASRSRFQLLRGAELPRECSRPLYEALTWVHYRRVFSVAAELQRSRTPAPTVRAKLKTVCRDFDRAGFRPKDFPCRMLRLPVRLRLITLIELSAWFAAKDRKRRLNY